MKIIWLVLSSLLMAALLLASCAPALTEEEEAAPPAEEDATTKEEETAPPAGTAAEHCERGITITEEGHYEQAISEFNKAIELDPTYAKAYYNRGLTYAKKGEVTNSSGQGLIPCGVTAYPATRSIYSRLKKPEYAIL